MPQCAKCGKVVKNKTTSYETWKYRDYSPEFYEKPLCSSCYDKLYDARIEFAGEAAIEQLCEHLRRMDLNATVESKLHPYPHWDIIGSVRVVNRNLDLVEIDWARKAVGVYGGSSVDVYRCSFVIQAKVDGLEDELRAYTEPVTSFFRVVDFEWKGKELAQALNSDADVRRTLHQLIVKYRGPSEDRPSVEIEPYRKDKCVRISPRFSYSPEAAFPTPEAFEVADRIAHHVRSMQKLAHRSPKLYKTLKARLVR